MALSTVQSLTGEYNDMFKLVLLDVCRDDPLLMGNLARMTRSIGAIEDVPLSSSASSATRGGIDFSPEFMALANDSLHTVWATSPGQRAKDLSPFLRAFVTHICSEGSVDQSVADFFSVVGAKVNFFPSLTSALTNPLTI